LFVSEATQVTIYEIPLERLQILNSPFNMGAEKQYNLNSHISRRNPYIIE